MWKSLKACFTKLVKDTAGKSLPDYTQKLTECYAAIDTENRWQGDVYSKENFNEASLPNPNIPYWMLVNRTCQLYEGGVRDVKIPYLNFITVYPLIDFVKDSDKSVKNAISDLIKGNLDGFIFLPARPENDLEVHLVVNFNLIYTFELQNAPIASDKLIQLSSPFCEYVFQRFSRFFYTVGYEDEGIKDKEFIHSVVEDCEKLIAEAKN